jgi:hypothetical protein
MTMRELNYAIEWFCHAVVLGAMFDLGWTYETIPGHSHAERGIRWQTLTLIPPPNKQEWILIESNIEATLYL